ncbi:MAG TPA: hypothetical protein VF041_03405 [Gemmatimonadaceae bacterium]
MAYDRDDIRAAVERAGDEHWQALIAHHEDAYPASPPTPGEVCRLEAERLNEMGLGDAADLELVETRITRVEPEIEVTHVVRHRPTGARLLTEPFRGYGPRQGA